MSRPARNYFPGQRDTIKPARSHAAVLKAHRNRLAVELGLSSFLAGQDEQTQRERYQIAARLVTEGLSNLIEASCSSTSHGRASITAFGRGR